MISQDVGTAEMQEAPTGRASNPSIEEHLEFERLLFEVSCYLRISRLTG